MPTLAQQFREEFREEFKEEFMETLGPQLKKEGKAEGKEEEKKEIVLQMLKRGFDLNTIMDITGLSKSEIEALDTQSEFH